MKGGEPFFFPGNRTGCLLVHGFTGAPNEMRALGEHLAHDGFTVLGIRLHGHGTRIEDLIRSREQDWIASVEDGFRLLEGCCDHIFVLGLSMGGVLALHAGAHLPAAGIIAMSAPHHTPNPFVPPLRPFLPLLSRVWRYAGKGSSDLRDEEAHKTHIDYHAHPVRAVAEFEDLVRQMRAALPGLKVPVLLIQSRADETVPAEHALQIQAALGSADNSIVWLENSGHVVTRDIEQEIVFKAAETFIMRIVKDIS